MVTNKKVESTKTLDKETMVTFTNEDFAKALAKRNVKTEKAFCLPLTAGNFGIEDQAVTPVPQYMIYHGKVAYSPFDFENDPPMKRNAYVEYSVWNTLYDPTQRYAGGKYAFASDGSDTLAEWVKANRNIGNKDVVTWFTAGFHHTPRMEDWPVMTTEWKTVHLMPYNFFSHNPAMTLRKPKD